MPSSNFGLRIVTDRLTTWAVVDVLKASRAANALGTLEQFREIAYQRPKAAPRMTYIYTGGLWSMSRGYGGLDTWTDERQPRSDYNGTASAWRLEMEDPLLMGR